MDFLEKNLETIIYETPDSILADRGLQIRGKRKRQLRIGNYGIADMVTFRSCVFDLNNIRVGHLVNIDVFEFKKDKIDMSTLVQACRYCRGIQRYLAHRELYWEPQFNIYLIGKEICLSDFCYLPNLIENLHVYSYKFDGIRFNRQHGFTLNEEGFGNG